MGNIIRGLFGKRGNDAPVRDVAALLTPHSSPAIQVIIDESSSLSHFGGSPNLPSSIEWPEKNGKKLTFLARISLTEVHRTLPVPWLPQSGALLFFYDVDQQPWGFDPKDRGGFAVVLVPDLPALNQEMRQSGEISVIPHRNVAMKRIDVMPLWENAVVRSLKLTEREWEQLEKLDVAAFDGKPRHQVSGLPSPQQGDDMDLGCQLASNGVYCGDAKGYKSQRASELKDGKGNWRLLFQMDSDDELEVMWGDGGMLYFWVEEQKARDGNFSNAWLILQCG
jgi:uncharacterized protein YwqG